MDVEPGDYCCTGITPQPRTRRSHHSPRYYSSYLAYSSPCIFPYVPTALLSAPAQRLAEFHSASLLLVRSRAHLIPFHALWERYFHLYKDVNGDSSIQGLPVPQVIRLRVRRIRGQNLSSVAALHSTLQPSLAAFFDTAMSVEQRKRRIVTRPRKILVTYH